MERIGEEVERTLASTGGGEGLALSRVTQVWPAAVGQAVARQAWPSRVGRNGTLYVATSSSVWAFELDRLAPEVEERLRALLGEHAPSRLRFQVGRVPEPGGHTGSGPATARRLPRDPESDAEAAAAAAAIDDPELREIVVRAARASLAGARIRPPFLVD